MTVALPAMAPAIIDSTVVSFFEARPALTAARSKKARVHSYPGVGSRQFPACGRAGEWKWGECEGRTVIVDKVRDADSEQSGLEPGVQTREALAPNNMPDCVEGCGVGPFGLDLGAGGEGDERVSRSTFSIVHQWEWARSR